MVTALRWNKYIQQRPLPKQAAFLLLPQREAFYGGAAGGGKSSTLLMGALQDVHMPGYAALLLRKTYADLAKPGALLDRAREWLGGSDARWSDLEKSWHFPTRHADGSKGKDATVTFGYLEHENDKYQYQSAEFQYCALDELTQFSETQYRYLFSRLRRLAGSPVPIRMRAASNPGNTGHGWVKQRFLIEGKLAGRPFIPAQLEDNPYLDIAEYEQALAVLDPMTREQLRRGNWDVGREGKLFQRQWFPIVEAWDMQARKIRCWDLAGTEVKATTSDPDWTAGGLLSEKKGQYCLLDMRRLRSTPKGVEELIQQTAALDGRNVEIWIEQEPGSSGKNTIDHYQRTVLKGYTVHGLRSTGSKIERAKPVSSAAEAGNFLLLQGPWCTTFLDEAEDFPFGVHDDQIDTCSIGVEVLGYLPKRAGAWGR